MAIIQQPDALSLSGNIKKFIIASSSPVLFTLSDADGVILNTSYQPGADLRVYIDVRNIVESRLSFLLLTSGVYEQTGIARTFTAVADGVTISFKVVRSGVDNLADTSINFLKGNFLTWQPTAKLVSYYSPEWLTYYAVQSCTVKLRAYLTGGAQQTVTLSSLTSGKAYTFNLQYAFVAGLLGNLYPTHFDVWVESSGSPLSYTQRYVYSDLLSEDERWYLFENSLGGIDCLRAYGDSDFSGEHKHQLTTSDGVSSEFRVDAKRVYNQNTGYLNVYERRWLQDLFTPFQKYVHTGVSFRKIILTDSDAKFSNSETVANFSFKYRFTDDSASYLLNLVRLSSAIPPVITVPNLSAPNFSIPPRLSEFPRVELGEGVIIPAFDPNSDRPSVTTVGALIAAAAVEILKQVPGNTPGGSGQLVTLIRLASEFAGSDDDVFSSSRTLAEIQRLIDAIPKYWKEDEFGNIYCERNVYSHQGITAYRGGDTEDDEPDELFVSLTLTEQFVATLVVNEISALLSLKGHQHTAEDITDLLDIFYTQTQIDTLLSNIDVGGGDGGVADSVDWANITNKPSTFPPSSHTHSQYLTAHQSITHLATKIELAEKADISHTHIIANITGLQAALDGKANTSHTHAISNITNLQSTLNNKVDKVTGKSLISDTEITRLSTVVNQTLNSLGAEPAFSKNTAFNKNFGTGANDVARGNHTHSASDITSGTLNDNRIPNLSISKITSLATELASKAPLNNPEFAGVAKAPVFQAPKFNLGNNWTIEGENGEVVLKLSGIIKFRLTGDGFISVGGIAAYGASTGDGLSDDFLKKDSAEMQTVNSKVVFANDVDFTDKDVTAHSLNVTNTAVVKDLETGTVKIGQTWSVVEDANGNLVFKKNGVIKHTING